MSVRVAAIVISHSQPEWLHKTLFALQNQTRPVDEIVAVDSSLEGDCLEVLNHFGVKTIVRRTDKNFGALVAAGVGQATSGFVTSTTASDLETVELEKLNRAIGWYWLLHEDSVPEPNALEQLLAAADLSPSVALLGPKQVDATSPKKIGQMGLTLTKAGAIFSLVDGELDQAQHDSTDDVLAIGTAGALIRSDLYRRLQGFDRHAPNLASEIDFSVRARLSGYRVVVVPSARVVHAAPMQSGFRSKRWSGASLDTAKRRAEIHLQLAYLPVSLVWLYALLLPASGLLRGLWRLASKRPNLIFAEISAAFWGFGTLPVRLLSRTRVNLNRDIKLSSLRPLRASWSTVRNRNRLLQDHVDLEPVAFDAAAAKTPSKKFSASGAWFIFFALLVSSWQLWPTNTAAVGGSLAPLSSDWFHLAGRAGSSWQNSGLGLAAPSDPFNWLLAGIGFFWFVTPSIALAVTILLSRSIAFAGAWHALGLVSRRAWLRNLLALAYAIWPSFVLAQNQGLVGAILTWMALPWLVLAVAKLASNSADNRSRGRQSSWLGVGGLLFAVVALSSAATAVLLLAGLVLVVATRPRRIGILIWVPSLAVLLVFPFAWYVSIGLGNPLAVLSDPGLPVVSQQQDFWQILLSVGDAGSLAGLASVALWPALFLLLAVLAWGTDRALVAAALTGFATLGAAAGFVLQRTDFVALGVNGSAAAVGSITALALLLAAGISLDSFKKRWLTALASGFGISLALLASFAAFGIPQPFSVLPSSDLKFSSGRTVPAIFEAEAGQGTRFRLLQITQEDSSLFSAQLVWADSLLLESNSTAYRFALPESLADSEPFWSVDALVANLVSANGADLSPAFARANIGYVMVPLKDSVDLAAALDAVPELESVGETEFGWLWSVKDASAAAPPNPNNQTWSITKGLQLFGILVFLLLAVPAGRTRRAHGAGAIFSQTDFDDAGPDFSSSAAAGASREGGAN